MKRAPRRHLLAAALLAAALTTAACGSDSGSGSTGSTSDTGSTSRASSTAALTGTITVFAAASLQEGFNTLGVQFEAAHPGTKVVFNFGPSSGLATSIVSGAPADVFASASQKNMGQVTAAKLATGPTAFVRNVMEIAVPAANPAKIASVNDLARARVKVAICQPQVPCGAGAATVFANAKITVEPVSEEVDVKSVLTKVSLGEVDAGVVYLTDVKSAGDKVKGIVIPAEVNASTTYPIVTLTGAPNAAAAAAFTAYVLSADGAAVLTADGFANP
ncbi:MAG: molybdate ABC transporter substrate-binding protein [Nostocoides sp.]